MYRSESSHSICIILLLIFWTVVTQETSGDQLPLLGAKEPDQSLIVTTVRNRPDAPHDSYLQCLRLPQPFHGYPTVGASLYMSASANVTVVVLPPRSEEGWHRPPAPMWFFLLRGCSRVLTPSTGDHVWIKPPDTDCMARDLEDGTIRKGDDVMNTVKTFRIETQVILALDIMGRGHLTFYPSDEETIALQVPLGSDWEAWLATLDVLHDGPC